MASCGGGLEFSPSSENLSRFVAWFDKRPGEADTPQFLNTLGSNVSVVPSRISVAGAAVSFSAAGSRVTTELPQGLLVNDWAVAFWLRSNDIDPATVIKFVNATGSTTLTLGWNENAALIVGVLASFDARGSGSTISALWGALGDLQDGQWHHVLIQQRADKLQAYFDGVPQGDVISGALPALDGTVSIEIGGQGWKGELDSVRLYNVALDSNAVPSIVYAWSEIRTNVEVDYVAYYPFSGNATNDTGRGLNGVVYGARLASDRHGEPNGAYAFDGVSAFIEVPEAYSPPMTNDWALGFWCLSNSPNVMVAIAVTPGLVALDLVFNYGSALSLHVNGNRLAILETGRSGALTDGRWHFVLLQQRDVTVELHIDGVQHAVRELRLPLAGDGSTFRFGSGSRGAASFAGPWQGALDDVQLHERSFNSAEIQRLSTLIFRPRDGAGLLAFRDELWMLGGWNSNNVPTTNSEVWRTADGSHWSLVTRAPWEGRHTAGWVAFNDRLWVVGGDRNSGRYQHDVWSSLDGLHWDLVTTQVPWSGRITPIVLTFQGRLWVMGGTTAGEEPGEGAAFNDVYSSADGVNWRLEVAQAPWAGRGLILGSLVFGGRMWIAGGGRYDDGRTYGNDLWSSANGIDWRQELAQAPWPGRQYHSVAVYHGKLWVVAGGLKSQPGGSRDVWYSPDGKRWVELPNTPWPERHAASLEVFQGRMWMLCGSNRSLLNDVWALNFA